MLTLKEKERNATILLIVAVAGCGSTFAAAPTIDNQGIETGVLAKVAPHVRFFRDELEIKGERPLFEPVLGARKVIIRAGARIILPARRDSIEYVAIVAEELVVEPGAEIVWAGAPPIEEIPPSRGKAANGLAGREDGANGGNGENGEPGNFGYAGRKAISVRFVVGRITGPGDLRITLKGQQGGPGGPGQSGGDGGAGARGSSASQSILDCKRGPGQGGNGGNGGAAGTGGSGGNGGDGGDLALLIVAQPDQLSTAGFHYFKADLSGGIGGAGGPPGSIGLGGNFGPEGQAAEPYCRSAGRTGSKGRDGAQSTKGPTGRPGLDGRLEVFPIDASQLYGLFLEASWQRPPSR